MVDPMAKHVQPEQVSKGEQLRDIMVDAATSKSRIELEKEVSRLAQEVERLTHIRGDAFYILDAFERSEAAGYRSRDRQFAIDLLKRHKAALSPEPAEPGEPQTTDDLDELIRRHRESIVAWADARHPECAHISHPDRAPLAGPGDGETRMVRVVRKERPPLTIEDDADEPTEAEVEAAARQIIYHMQFRDFGHTDEDGDFIATPEKIELLEQCAGKAAQAALKAARAVR